MIITAIIFGSIVIVMFGAAVMLMENFCFGCEDEEAEAEAEKVPLVQRLISAIKQLTSSLLATVRSILGTPPKAERARRKAQRKKAGV